MKLLVVVIMGSILDWVMMKVVCFVLEELGIFYEKWVILVYRIFDLMFCFVEELWIKGLKVIIVGVGGVVYLLGMVVVKIILFVIGVLVKIWILNGIDLLLFIV